MCIKLHYGDTYFQISQKEQLIKKEFDFAPNKKKQTKNE